MSSTPTPSSPSAGSAAGGLRILLAGESWVTHSTHVKGFDVFHTAAYTEGATEFIAGIRDAGHDLTYVPAHEIPARFPRTGAELAPYDVVVISDVGTNTFLLSPETARSEITPNRLEAVAEYVTQGGALLMVGGYMSFAGIDGRARYGSSPLARALPVTPLDHDDRVELPEGFVAEVAAPDHPALHGMPGPWPPLLGYNRVLPREDAEVLVVHGQDPILAVGHFGTGRTAAFASDLAPHWAPPGFLEWPGYARLWDSLMSWLAGRDGGATRGA